MIATKQDILAGLRKMEKATRDAGEDRITLYVDFLLSKKITKSQMLDAVRGCMEHSEKGFFPSTAQVLQWARPSRVNAPPEGEQSTDAIVMLENEITVQTQWLRKFERDGDEYHIRMARLAIERAQEKINRRLLARGLGPRYVAVGVEVFGSDDPPRTKQTEHWTTEPESD